MLEVCSGQPNAAFVHCSRQGMWAQAPCSALLRQTRRRPLAQAGLDEPLRLAVGLWPVRLRKGVLDFLGLAGLAEKPEAVLTLL
jgi:hypothetical protein